MSDDRGAADPARTQSGPGHVPVFLERTIDLFAPVADPDGREPVLVDGTLGLGGHTEALLSEFPRLRVIGVDRDPEAHRLAAERLDRFGDRFVPVHARFDDFEAIDEAVSALGADASRTPTIDGVLLDFGVSSMQLDEADRGFAYSVDAPLDMRMDPTRGRTAADVLADYSESQLRRIFREFGEEKFAGKIAREIVGRRADRPFSRSGDLVELLYATIPAGARRTGGHPAKRVFQALRIEVNSELEAVEHATTGYLERLRVGGRAVFMAYHSLEDRIVKRELARRTASRTPAGLPVELPGHGPEFRAVTRGAEKAGEAEVAANPRSASVRVRCVERNPADDDSGGPTSPTRTDTYRADTASTTTEVDHKGSN